MKIIKYKQKRTEDPEYYLGIDWGASRIGLAVADDAMRIATGLEDISATDALEKIKTLDSQYDFKKFVLGVPKHKGFSRKNELEKFLKELAKLGKEVIEEDESFSTKVAQKNLSEKNIKGISHSDNMESARLILQGFLDKRAKK
jgi:RNase H-fold protein (predicted Holliday junction resolvase)